MAVLPDRTALGDLPSALSGRSHPNYESVTEPGRGYAAGFERLGEGQRELGRGIERFGQGLENYGQTEQAKEDKLNGSMADANQTIYESNFKQAIDNETDPEKIKQMLDGAGEGYKNASSILSGDQAKLFDINAQSRANNLRLYGQKRIDLLNEDAYKASARNTIDGLQKAFTVGDLETKRDAIAKAGKLFDDMAENGYLSREQAVTNKNNFARGAEISFIQSQPVDKQFELLGVSQPGEIAAKNLSPTAKAFLVAVGGPESNNKYDVRYTPAGGATFNGFDKHPNILEPTKDGKKSSAAGRYQFTGTTWRDVAGQLGLSNFSPENQDVGAWFLAQRDYKKNTGRDLEADLKKDGLTPKIMSSLGGTWEAWQSNGGQRKSASLFKATLDNAPSAEGSYEIASNNPNYFLSPEEHAKLVNNAFAQKKKELDLQHAQTIQEINNSQSGYYQRLTDNKLDNLLEDIQNDPVLRLHPKEQLQMMDIARKHIDQIAKNKGGDYGSGYTEGFDGVMKGDITTPQQLYQMNQEGKLTIHGVQQLKTMMNDLRSKPEKAVEQKVIAGQLAYAQSKLNPLGMKTGPGAEVYNSTFIPAFYSRYNSWVKAGKDPYDFLSKENTDKLIKEISDKNKIAQDRVTAGVEGQKSASVEPSITLPPPPGINQSEWGKLSSNRPNASDGKPMTSLQWTKALKYLVEHPDAQTRGDFGKKFNMDADQVLKSLGVVAR